MTQLTAYLTFNGNCGQAMTFYQQVLGGKLEVNPLKDSPMAQNMPAEKQDWLIHSDLQADGIRLFASDKLSPAPFTPGNTMSLCLHSEDKQQITNLYNKLKEGGKVNAELQDAFFGLYGEVTDKYGVTWMFQAGPQTA
jgi:PhnB protein